jgi:hypothetical protein
MKQLILLVALVGLYGCGPLDGAGSSSTAITSDGGCSDTWSSYGQSFFPTNCAGSGCHHSFSPSSHSDVQNNAGTLSWYISGGSMPRGRSLSSSERTRVLTYLACGAP